MHALYVLQLLGITHIPEETDDNISRAGGSSFPLGEALMEGEARSAQAAANPSSEAALSRALGCLVHPTAYLLVYYQLI